jgi:hypothetical protein
MRRPHPLSAQEKRVRPKAPGLPVTVMPMMVMVVSVVVMTPVVMMPVVVAVVVMSAPMHQLYAAGRIGLCGLEGLRQSRGRGGLRSRGHHRSSQQQGCGR